MILAIIASPSEAYECDLSPDPLCGCALNNDRPEYHLVVADFPASHVTEIEAAAESWWAGNTQILRGADFKHVRGVDNLAGVANNGVSELWDESSTWFTALGFPSTTLAITTSWMLGWPNCDVVESDIVFNESTVWSTSLPGALPTYSGATSEVSIGQTAVHEFGHVVGFDHENDVLAVMNGFYPAGGDISATKYRIHEDDFAGLLDWYPCVVGCDGVNVMLSKFEPASPPNGSALEVYHHCTVNSLSP